MRVSELPPGRLRAALLMTRAIVSDVIALAILLFSFNLRRLGTQALWLLLPIIVADLCWVAQGCLSELFEEGSFWESVTHGFRLANVFRFVGACSLLFWVIPFSGYAYPHIYFSLGGGQPRDVVFVLTDNTSQVAPFLVRDGAGPLTVPYKLLLENEQSFVVVSPKDGQKVIEFDRKAVLAMIVLGKRPGSAGEPIARRILQP